jgi:hypothetical protein
MPAFTLLGAPIDSVGFAQTEPHGTELAPAAWRAAGLADFGWTDLGDLPVHRERRMTRLRRDRIDDVLWSPARSEAIATCRPRVAARQLLHGAPASRRSCSGPVNVTSTATGHDGRSGFPTGEAADMPVAIILGEDRRRRDHVAPLPCYRRRRLPSVPDALSRARRRSVAVGDA